MSDLRDYLLVEGLPGRSREVTDGVEYKQAARRWATGLWPLAAI